MEVDTCSAETGNPYVPQAQPGVSALATVPGLFGLPRIDEASTSPQSPKDRLITVLDQVEIRVERLRKDACRIEEEKDGLLSTLDSIRQSDLLGEIQESDKEDILRYTDRICGRAQTVEVTVRTERDTQQEEALHQVNLYIDQLVMSVHEDTVVAHTRCQSFMNACSSSTDFGATDKNFESAILGCTLDDQKRVKRRLQGLMDYFAKLNITMYATSVVAKPRMQFFPFVIAPLEQSCSATERPNLTAKAVPLGRAVAVAACFGMSSIRIHTERCHVRAARP